MVATAASRRLTPARCLLTRGVQIQQGGASLLDCGEVGNDLLQLVADVFGDELQVQGRTGIAAAGDRVGISPVPVIAVVPGREDARARPWAAVVPAWARCGVSARETL